VLAGGNFDHGAGLGIKELFLQLLLESRILCRHGRRCIPLSPATGRNSAHNDGRKLSHNCFPNSRQFALV
jgi:hypothetical protein